MTTAAEYLTRFPDDVQRALRSAARVVGKGDHDAAFAAIDRLRPLSERPGVVAMLPDVWKARPLRGLVELAIVLAGERDRAKRTQADLFGQEAA